MMLSRVDPIAIQANEAAENAPSPGRIAAPTLPLIGYGLVVTAVLLLHPSTGFPLAYFSSCSQVMAGIAGAGFCGYSAWRGSAWDSRTRLAWWLFTASLLMHTIGHVIYAYTQLMLRSDNPTGLTDFFWIMQRPFTWAALLLLARPRQASNTTRLILDALIIVLAALVLCWTMMLAPLLFGPDAESATRNLYLFIVYPLADVGVLFCLLIMVATTRAKAGMAKVIELLVIGVLDLIITQAFFLYDLLRDAYASGNFLDVGWVWGPLLIGAAALLQSHVGTAMVPSSEAVPEIDSAERAMGSTFAQFTGDSDYRVMQWRRAVTLWLPSCAAILVAATFLVWEVQHHNDTEMQRWMPMLVLMVAIVVRQMLTLADNLKLTEELGASNEDLERNVTERTRHLATLHAITSTLNTSLDQNTVLRATLEETMAAVAADSGGIWLCAIEATASDSTLPDEEALSRPDWTLVHSTGFAENTDRQEALRDLAITIAEERRVLATQLQKLMPEAAVAPAANNPVVQNFIIVPIRWQGTLLGSMGMVRWQGSFKWEDRALVESVALEAGAALQNARLYHEASRRADRDSVTDLFNHRAIQQQLNGCLMQSRISNEEFGLIIMDLNNFKFFNDTYGHIVGDEVLRTVADVLREACRTTDILGRFGGDEFIALLPDTDSVGTTEVCARIASLLDSRHFQAAPDLRVPITMSFGWSVYPHDGEAALDLITRADAELYEHKRGGGTDYAAQRRDASASREETRKMKNSSWGGSFGVLDALVTAIDNKDHYTRRHSEEVTKLSLLVAKELGYSEQGLRAVRISGLLHDVGKIAVPDAILRHPGRLGPEEARIMRQHPVLGALIVKDLPHLDQVLDGIRHHHERWDGRGYPDGLGGASIPAMGRLLAVADCYSAMTTDRPYRKAFSPQAAIEEIDKLKGTQFDPVIGATFVRVMRQELIAPAPDIDSHMPLLNPFETVMTGVDAD